MRSMTVVRGWGWAKVTMRPMPAREGSARVAGGLGEGWMTVRVCWVADLRVACQHGIHGPGFEGQDAGGGCGGWAYNCTSLRSTALGIGYVGSEYE